MKSILTIFQICTLGLFLLAIPCFAVQEYRQTKWGNRTYYEILKISETANEEQIKTAFRKLAREFHPDVAQGDKAAAEEKFKAVNEAFEVLGDPQKKSIYDSYRSDCQESVRPSPQQRSYEDPPPRRNPGYQYQERPRPQPRTQPQQSANVGGFNINMEVTEEMRRQGGFWFEISILGQTLRTWVPLR